MFLFSLMAHNTAQFLISFSVNNRILDICSNSNNRYFDLVPKID
uniref:Uncharacterized protein n=1 Tax=Anopheles quadriannulatus TaxID=34691 RepID=A0A182XR34_ANOQN